MDILNVSMSKKGNSHSKKTMNEKLLAGIIIGVIVILTLFTFLIGGKGVVNKVANKVSTSSPALLSPTPFRRPPTPTVSPGETIMVTIHGFVPDKLTIKKGTSVNFANFSDTDTVDVEADDPKMTQLNIGVIKNNDTSNPVQLAAGVYTYHNQLKPTQKGTIVVQ